MQRLLNLIAPVVILAPLGCNSVDSDSVFTSALYARISATSDGGGETTVQTTLFLEDPGSLNYIELEGDDELNAYGPAGESRQMSEFRFLGQTHYSASFNGEDAGSEFIVELVRTVDDSAPDSWVTLPDPFDITTADGSSISRATDDVVIDWTPASGDDLNYDVGGTCIGSFSGTVEGDPGTLTIAAADLVLSNSDEPSCVVTVGVNRNRPGTIDAAYGHGGDAVATQRRTFSFTTVP